MKGLLVKDFKLLKLQRNSIFYILIIFFGMAMLSSNVSSSLSFFTFVFSLFPLNSVSYDEFDNGNAFLFSLPITRTGYVIEKYCFALIINSISWAFATTLVMVIAYLKGTNNLYDIFVIALALIPVVLITISVMFPFQLKFGGDKGRVAIICTFGLVSLVVIALVKISELFHIDIVSIFNNLPVLNLSTFFVLIYIVAFVMLFISIKISMIIMNKKEF